MTSHDTPATSGNAPTTGQALRTLREAQGLTPEDVCSRIKFSARQIRALENEDWETLPTGVSLRGLVRSYARMLGADADSLAESVSPQVSPHNMRPDEDHVNRHGTRVPGAGRVAMVVSEESSVGISWGWLVALLLFVAAALAYAFSQGWLPKHWLPAGWL